MTSKNLSDIFYGKRMYDFDIPIFTTRMALCGPNLVRSEIEKSLVLNVKKQRAAML